MAENEQKVALVTGGSRGIGRAIALRLAAEGAYVVVNYAKNREAAEDVVSSIEKAGGHARVSGFDVSDFDTVQEEIENLVTELGGIHILVNNAGITQDTLIVRMKKEDWDNVMTTNLNGVFNCTKAVARIMIKQRYGRIINLTSVVGEMGNSGQTNYAASKAGIIGFTKAAARELASRAITVNAVSPGFIETDITQNLTEEIRKQYIDKIPLQRFGSPEDVAGVVSFLASDEASYITGEVLRVNGGIYT
ncbi:MAG TPA: 3-oxoacyl-[acyl-carrier-protein] reductase [Thermodesulfobacteriota bacterium]|mgnify:FL=1|nr:3-oxoacyl-[acyl-carrier-protein] reductase [Thermodesulfobacteriota bacterium]